MGNPIRPGRPNPQHGHDRIADELSLIRHALFVLVRRQLGNMSAEEEEAERVQIAKLSADLRASTDKLSAAIESQKTPG